MGKRMVVGAAAGVLGGLFLALLMRALPVMVAEGSQISMITFAALAIHADRPWAGWLAYLVYAVVVGALFGLAIRARTRGEGLITFLGGVWGLGWCIVTGLALIPTLLGLPPFSHAALRQAQEIAVPLVVGHVGYGILLGAAFGLIMGALDRPGRPGSTVIRRAA